MNRRIRLFIIDTNLGERRVRAHTVAEAKAQVNAIAKRYGLVILGVREPA